MRVRLPIALMKYLPTMLQHIGISTFILSSCTKTTRNRPIRLHTNYCSLINHKTLRSTATSIRWIGTFALRKILTQGTTGILHLTQTERLTKSKLKHTHICYH